LIYRKPKLPHSCYWNSWLWFRYCS